jgi:choline dehydrogenase
MTAIPDEWKDADRTGLDFIIVGAGAGGAPLASRLVERGYTVLAVEMGPEKPTKPQDSEVEDTEVPLLHSETTEDDRHSLRFFVKHFDEDPAGSTDPKVHQTSGPPSDEDGIFYPRAQGVGGCTVHNAMITVCGASEDWDEIAEATGDESWRGERMRPYFQRLERCNYDQPSLWARLKGMLGFGTGWEKGRHGHRGWLDTTLSDLRFVKRDRRLLRVVLGAALAALRAGVVRPTELLRTLISGRVFPSLDPNHWATMRQGEEGLKRIPCAVTPTGERSGPRARLLALKAHPAHGQRLHLLTGVFVTEVVLEKENEAEVRRSKAEWRATGIKCLPREHTYEADPNSTPVPDDWREQQVTLRCRREIILCGGTFNTPQLLMISGIGPEDHLRDHGIDVRVKLSGVGKNLQDRYEVPIIATVTDRFRSLDGLSLSSKHLDPELRRWRDNADKPAFSRGLYATNGGLISILVRSGQEDVSPDLFIFALAGYFPGYFVHWSTPGSLIGLRRPGQPNAATAEPFGLWTDAPPDQVASAPRRKLTWLILKARTRHHMGEVRLQSRLPFKRPQINFRSFPLAPDAELDPTDPSGPFPISKDQDLEALHQGVQFVRDIVEIGKKKGTIESVEWPGFEAFNGNIRKWIKHTAWGHHACGTCQIGSDKDTDAVLDSRFRVRGVTRLRVVDASIFPSIPGFFIVTNVYMIAEKAADVMTEDHPIEEADLPPEVNESRRLDPVLPSSAAFEARRLYPELMEAAEADLIAARRKAAGL